MHCPPPPPAPSFQDLPALRPASCAALTTTKLAATTGHCAQLVSWLQHASLTCVVDLRPGGEILAQLTVPAAQEQPKVTPCSSSTGRTTQGLPASGSRA